MSLKDIPEGTNICLQAPFLHGYAYGTIKHYYCLKKIYQGSCLSPHVNGLNGTTIRMSSDAKITPHPYDRSFFIDMVN